MASEFYYWRNCTDFHGLREVTALQSMLDRSIEVTRRTFLAHVNHEDLNIWAESMGYSSHPKQGLTLAGDWHVSYHRSKIFGKWCYYIRHSSIEHIWVCP